MSLRARFPHEQRVEIALVCVAVFTGIGAAAIIADMICRLPVSTPELHWYPSRRRRTDT